MEGLNFLEIEQETEEEFKNIAEILFNKYAIETKDHSYRIVELEFYWNSSTHKDKSTYERKYVDPQQGEWFFHYSGVDIALRNENGYGGILIRGLQDINSGDFFKGPQVCTMKLFSGIKAFSKDFSPRLIEYIFSNEQLSKTERIGLGNNAKESGFNKVKYRFVINPHDNRL